MFKISQRLFKELLASLVDFTLLAHLKVIC